MSAGHFGVRGGHIVPDSVVDSLMQSLREDAIRYRAQRVAEVRNRLRLYRWTLGLAWLWDRWSIGETYSQADVEWWSR